MGLFDKLKNVLFEEEEVEEVVEEQPKETSKSTMQLPKINRKPKKESYDFEEETDRELFKHEDTFDFPAFDEEEFKEMVPNVKEETILVPYDSDEKKEEIKSEKVNIEEKVERRVTPSYTQTKRSEYTSTRVLKPAVEQPKKIFRPSPVISPVYGILDKNYKKEDVLTKDEVNEKKNMTLDVDSVRKKAFGTLEEDLANTLAEPLDKFYEEVAEEKVETSLEDFMTEEVEIVPEVKVEKEEIVEDSIDLELDNLLEDTVDIEIDVTKEMELPSRVSKYEEKEEVIESIEDFEEVPEKVVVDEIEDEVSDDTLENDLFDLIDSMYENKEDED